MTIRRLTTVDPTFSKALDKLLSWESVSDQQVAQTVDDIIQNIRSKGNAALIELTNRFDRRNVTSIEQLIVSNDELQQALQSIPAGQRQALEAAAERVTFYHEKQQQSSWQQSMG